MVRKVLEHETTVWMMFVYTHGLENDVASSLSHVSGQLSGVTCVLSPHGLRAPAIPSVLSTEMCS